MTSQADDYPKETIIDFSKNLILHKVHPHELCFATLKKGYSCDICRDYPIKTSYKCTKCDFDYCTKCYDNKNIPAELPVRAKPDSGCQTGSGLPPLFTHDPIACDFYKKTIVTRIDAPYYNQMLDMLFKLIAKHEHVIWHMTIQNRECSIRMILPIDSDLSGCKCNKNDCNNCKTLMYCQQCGLAIRIDRGTSDNIKCDYAAPTDKPFYTVLPMDLREKYWTEKYTAIKKHVDDVLHQFYMDEVLMTLEGSYMA